MASLDHADRRLRLSALFSALDRAAPEDLPSLVADHFTPDAVAHVCHPFNDLQGPAIAERFYHPLKRALPRPTRRLYALMAGRFNDGDWACAMGVLDAAFTGALFGLQGHGQFVQLRFGEFHRFEGERIAESVIIIDVIDFLRQIGIQPLPAAPAGAWSVFPAPVTGDGVRSGAPRADETGQSLDLVESMIFGLKQFDGANLKSMGMTRFWSDDMSWYGPGGIGAARGLKGFEMFHQKPFLAAFPDRVGGHHKARFADGAFVASTGWPSIHATFAQPWLGVPATGGPITMRVMDWWRREGDVLVENWVFIDVPDVLRQAGFDVLERLRVAASAEGGGQ